MGSNSYLPEDIIRDILLRLPVRSLLRFMATSKHWFALITSAGFISNHYQHPSNPKLCVMLTRRDSYSLSVYRDGPERVDDHSIPSEKELEKYGARIVGSGNGLLCLSRLWKDACYTLWNPATRQYRKLPPHKGIGYSHGEGFGFHQGINDYKLLQLVSDLQGQSTEAEVYALSTDSWRKVEDAIPSYDYSISHPVVVKGVWYNLAVHEETPFIMRFDMGDDSFSKVKAAPLSYNHFASYDHYLIGEPIDQHLYKVELMVYKELPATCTYDCDRSILALQFDLWVMKNESWTKICSGNSLNIDAQPFGFWVDEESIILELYTNALSSFNLLTEQSKMLLPDKAFVSGRTYNYVESMVSVYTTN